MWTIEILPHYYCHRNTQFMWIQKMALSYIFLNPIFVTFYKTLFKCFIFCVQYIVIYNISQFNFNVDACMASCILQHILYFIIWSGLDRIFLVRILVVTCTPEAPDTCSFFVKCLFLKFFFQVPIRECVETNSLKIILVTCILCARLHWL